MRLAAMNSQTVIFNPLFNEKGEATLVCGCAYKLCTTASSLTSKP